MENLIMMPKDKIVAVILVNWNSYPVTADCIASLQGVSYASHDVIVVDNGSSDNSGGLLKEKFPHIILIESDTNRGFTGGNNLGMNYAIGNGYTYVMLLNNDTFVKPDFLGILVNYMDGHPQTGAIQPLIYFHHIRSLVWNASSGYNNWLGSTYTRNYNRRLQQGNAYIKEVDWITGCALFIRTNILREVGLFAENMFIYYEDVDLSFRIRKAGHKLVYHPGSVIYHIAGMSSRSLTKGKEGFLKPIVHYHNLRNRIWMLKQYTPLRYAPTACLFTFFYIIALMVYFAVRWRFEKLMAVIKAVRDGITGRINY